MASTSLLDPIVVAQLGNLHLRARRVLDGLFSGRHFNRNQGSSKEFSQHRPYNPGDDPKGLDWKIFGRTDRLVIKQYEEETNVLGTVLLDDSASMAYTYGGRPSKLDYAKVLAAAFGYLLISQNDAVGLLSSDHQLPPNSQRGHLEPYLQALESQQPKGIWDIKALSQSMRGPFKRKGFVIVLSDLMGEPEVLISTLRALHAQKNEVMVFQILDPTERDLKFDGPVIFEDAETQELLQTEPEVIQKRYQKIMKDRITAFSQAFRSAGMDYSLLTTDTPFDKGLGHFLSWRGIFL